MKVIIITGTPGTGKSALAKRLAEHLNFKRIDLHHYYKQISTGYNRSRQSYDIELERFKQLIKGKAKQNNLIVDSHITHLLPKSMVDLCIVLTCSNLKLLGRRLKRRDYSDQKIKENLQAEIFQICLNQAREKKHRCLVLDITKQVSFRKILNTISRFI